MKYFQNLNQMGSSFKQIEPQLMLKVLPVASKTILKEKLNINCYVCPVENTVTKNLSSKNYIRIFPDETLISRFSNQTFLNNEKKLSFKSTADNKQRLNKRWKLTQEPKSAKVEFGKMFKNEIEVRKKKSTVHFTPLSILRIYHKSSDSWLNNKHKQKKNQHPHVNIGKKYQAFTPNVSNNSSYDNSACIWKPNIASERQIQQFLKWAYSISDIKEEVALEIFFTYGGDLQQSISKILSTSLFSSTSDVWSESEINKFLKAIKKHGKNFEFISKLVTSKSTKQCIELYYQMANLAPKKHYG